MPEENDHAEPCQALINVRGHLRTAEHRLKRAHQHLRRMADWTDAYLSQHESATRAEGFDLAGEALKLLAENEQD